MEFNTGRGGGETKCSNGSLGEEERWVQYNSVFLPLDGRLLFILFSICLIQNAMNKNQKLTCGRNRCCHVILYNLIMCFQYGVGTSKTSLLNQLLYFTGTM